MLELYFFVTVIALTTLSIAAARAHVRRQIARAKDYPEGAVETDQLVEGGVE